MEAAPQRASIASGAAITSFAQGTTYLCGFVTSIVISRALGAEGRGAYTLPATAAGIGMVIAHLSVELSNTYHFAERRHGLRELAAGSTLLAVLSGPVAVLLLLAFYLVSRDTLFSGVPEVGYFIAIASVPFGLLSLWFANLFVLADRLARAQIATLLGALLQLCGVVAFDVAGALTVEAVLAWFTVATCIPGLLMVWWGRSFAPLSLRGAAPVARAVVARGLKLHTGFLFSFLLMRIDIFYVSAFLTTRDVGLYSLGVFLAELVWLVTSPLALAVLPHQVATTVASSAELTFKAVRFSVFIALVLAALLAATLWYLTPWIYGEVFSPSYEVVLLLLPGIVALAATRPLVSYLVRQDRPWLWSGLSVGALVVNAVLNVLLLPELGLAGACVASSVAYVALAWAYVRWAASTTGTRPADTLRPRKSDVETVRRAVGAVLRRVRERRAVE